MAKWNILLALILLTIGTASPFTVQYSEDNTTWQNVTNTDQNFQTAYQAALVQDTLYYFRGSNDTINWSYKSQKTKSGFDQVEAEEMILAIIFGTLIFMAFYIALAVVNSGFKLKMFCYGMAMIQMITMAGLIYAVEADIDITEMLRVNFMIHLIIGFGIGMISMFMHTTKIVNMEDNLVNETPDKWENNKW